MSAVKRCSLILFITSIVVYNNRTQNKVNEHMIHKYSTWSKTIIELPVTLCMPGNKNDVKLLITLTILLDEYMKQDVTQCTMSSYL